MDFRVDIKGCVLDPIVALQDVAALVTLTQTGRCYFRPVPAIGVDQKPFSPGHAIFIRHGDGEVIVDALVQIVPRCPAEPRCQVEPEFLNDFLMCAHGFHPDKNDPIVL